MAPAPLVLVRHGHAGLPIEVEIVDADGAAHTVTVTPTAALVLAEKLLAAARRELCGQARRRAVTGAMLRVAQIAGAG